MKRMTPLYKGIKLNCTIVSDTHIDVKNPLPWLPPFFLKSSLKDAQYSSTPVDAFITVGDTTSRGSKENWKIAGACFARYNPASRILLTLGNHDAWSDGDYEEAIEEYKKNVEIISGQKRDLPYFSEIINGYHLIFLGSDSDAGCEAQISDGQFAWFCREMEAAGKSGKPIFVFCHQSLNQKHGLPRTWDRDDDPNRDPLDGGIGEKSDVIEAELKKYENVFYFSGHSHMGLGGENCKKANGYASFEQEDGLTLINLPSLSCGNHHGDTHATGIGVQLEVYEDRVLIRPRSFSKHCWNKKIPILNGKPYFEKTIG